MEADEDRVAGGVGETGAHVERDEDIVLAGQNHLEALLLQERAKLASDVERELFFGAESVPGAFIETAVAGIEHDGLNLSFLDKHLRTQLRLDGFGEIDARDEELVVLRNDGEAKPVAHTVHDGFAAVEGDLELVPAVIENDDLARGIDVADEAVKLCDVVDGQVIAGADFDDLPIRGGLGRGKG